MWPTKGLRRTRRVPRILTREEWRHACCGEHRLLHCGCRFLRGFHRLLLTLFLLLFSTVLPSVYVLLVYATQFWGLVWTCEERRFSELLMMVLGTCGAAAAVDAKSRTTSFLKCPVCFRGVPVFSVMNLALTGRQIGLERSEKECMWCLFRLERMRHPGVAESRRSRLTELLNSSIPSPPGLFSPYVQPDLSGVLAAKHSGNAA